MSDARRAAEAFALPDETARAFRLEQFHDFLALERGAADTTQEAYMRDVARFAAFARSQAIAAPGDATPRALREFVFHLKDLGLAPSSIRRTVSAVRTYYRFLLGEGHVSRDPERAAGDAVTLAHAARGADRGRGGAAARRADARRRAGVP
jgi:site-specific recombinase XerD